MRANVTRGGLSQRLNRQAKGGIICLMNPLLARLQPYPFERLRQLHADITPNPAYKPISLGIGEPRHATPQLVKDAISASFGGLASYPGTLGEPKLRQTIAAWLKRRYSLSVDPATQVLPVNGSREALFSLAQTVIDPQMRAPTLATSCDSLPPEEALPALGRPVVICPNPLSNLRRRGAFGGR